MIMDRVSYGKVAHRALGLRALAAPRGPLAPAVPGQLRDAADWALTALGAAGLAIIVPTGDDVPEVLESRGVLRVEHAQALAHHYHGSPLERALAGTCGLATLSATPERIEPPALGALRAVGIRAVLAIPLGGAEPEGVGGVFVVAWRDPHPRVDHTLLSRLASYVALALAYTCQHKQLQRERRFSDLMQQATDATAHAILDSSAAFASPNLHPLVAHAVAELEARAGALAVLQDDGGTVSYVAVHNLPHDVVGTRVPAGEGLVGRVLQTEQPVLLDREHPQVGPDTLRAACDAPIWMAVPIRVLGLVRGVLSVAADPPRRTVARDIAALQIFARYCGCGLRLMRLLERAQHAAAIEQRQVLARDLHDSVTQTVFGLQLAAQVALDSWAVQPTHAHEALEMVLRLALGASAELRTLLFELRENALESEGLGRALERYVDLVRHRSGLAVDLQAAWLRRLPEPHEEALYRVAQEALTNVVKHARAAHASVTLAVDARTASLHIADDGMGFTTPAPAFDSYGLVVMRERVSSLGGTLRLGNRPEGGAFVHAELPLPEEAV
jgi:signal transduction histidine kinase